MEKAETCRTSLKIPKFSNEKQSSLRIINFIEEMNKRRILNTDCSNQRNKINYVPFIDAY